MKHIALIATLIAAAAGSHAALADQVQPPAPTESVGHAEETEMQLIKNEDTIALSVRTAGGIQFFRRAGIRFSQTPTVIALADWPKTREGRDKLAAIVAEQRLVVTELSKLPDERDQLHMSPEQMAEEVIRLRKDNEAMADELAALRAGRSPGADYESMSAADLESLAHGRGLQVRSKRKADIIEALTIADMEGPELELQQVRAKLEAAEAAKADLEAMVDRMHAVADEKAATDAKAAGKSKGPKNA